MSAVAPNDADVRNIQFAPGNDAARQLAPLPSSLPVCLRHDGVDRRRSAIDVSEEGMFVESPDHVPQGEAVQILVVMPGEKTMRVLATVERIVTPDEAAFCGGMPGMGLRFLMMDRRLETRWLEYLGRLAASALPKRPDPEAVEHRVEGDGSRRSAPRKPGRFEVRIADEGALRTFFTRNVSRGGMFLATSAVSPVGSRLKLVVRHPVSGRQYPMPAEVRWVKDEGPEDERGMGVQLLGRDQDRMDAFLRFVNEG